MKKLLMILITVGITTNAWAQLPDPGPQIEKMARLSFLEGTWEGSGWIQMGPEPRQKFTIEENIHYEIGGLVLVLEGHGKSGDETTHQAFAVASFDPESGSYQVRAWEMHGRFINADAAFVGDQFRWSFSTPMGSIRYSISLDDQGRWRENGEWSGDGKTWRQFMEMTLSKVE